MITITKSKDLIIDKLNKLKIERSGNTILTIYDGRTICTDEVSKVYEVFDISAYMIEKIDFIEKNFKIDEYKLEINKGIQSIKITSNIIELNNGFKIQKTFFILNSTNRTKRLSFKMGLNGFGFTYIGGKNINVLTRHVTGVNNKVNDISDYCIIEKFDNQVDDLNNLIDHSVRLGDVKNVILNPDNIENYDIPEVNKRKYSKFKSHIVGYVSSETAKGINNDNLDVELDAFLVLVKYLSIFSRSDYNVIHTESMRIFNITKYSIRNKIIDSILNL